MRKMDASPCVATMDDNGRGLGFYVELFLVGLALLAVLAWLVALIWVAVTGGPEIGST
jgi:hypothetical protein